MTLIQTVREFLRKTYLDTFGPPKKRPASEAFAEKFLWEILLTDKWNCIFRYAWFSAEGLNFGTIGNDENRESILSLGRLPSRLVCGFVVRQVHQRLDVRQGFREIRFVGTDRNDNVTVSLCGEGESWMVVGVRVIFLGDYRTDDQLLITDYIPVS
jgi:hypothetical protein